MNLLDFIQRQAVPEPWSEGEKIPWNDPDFSQRMLQEHLTQAHDAASRRFAIIDQQVAWIQQNVLTGGSACILDLGCGPGFYTARLAQLGHACMGIDFSPASIRYAREHAPAQCSYLQEDIRTAEYGQGYDLVMSIFGEFNVFKPADARTILRKAWQALAENGRLLIEPHTFAAVHAIGMGSSAWYSSPHGLFSDRPHICLMENFWNEQECVATERYFIVDGKTGEVSRHASSMQAYTDEQYQSLLEECGFKNVTFHPALTGETHSAHPSLQVIICQK